ncbi:MAG: 2-hydroxy-3-oxopropionate reductase [Actinomycetota bacterium]|nr:2-hydroxy-3-oxopropionate reductase [Actinomycetota bacterium]
MSETVGFIGLGVMGGPMAANLLKAGHTLVVNDVVQENVDKAVAAGAKAASTAREVGEQADVVITMLPDSSVVEAVMYGDDGVLAGLSDGKLLVDMSSIHPTVSIAVNEQAAKKGVSALDAPVSGGDVGAQQGTLSIMVGGDEAAFERAKPYFEVLGKTIVLVGGPGAGQVVKACNQVVVAVSIQAVSEALVLGSKAGVAPDRILDVLSGGLAGNKVMEVRRKNFLEHNFTPGFRIDLHHKDLKIALETAGAYDVALPTTAIVQQAMNALRANGHGSDDHSGLLRLVEEQSNHTIGSNSNTSNN